MPSCPDPVALERFVWSRPGFAAWNAGNRLMTSSALPLWFHGTTSGGFNVFAQCDENSIGFHFGSVGAAQKRLADVAWHLDDIEDHLVMPVLLRAQNPLRLTDGGCWGMEDISGDLADLGLVSEDLASWLADCGDDVYVFALLEELGYDAVVYRNIVEEEGDLDSVFIWRPEQVKSVFSQSFDALDPRLLPQVPLDAAMRDDMRWCEAFKESLERVRAIVRERLWAEAAVEDQVLRDTRERLLRAAEAGADVDVHENPPAPAFS